MTDGKTLSPEQAAALELFKQANGRSWKQRLLNKWWDGSDANEPGGCYLRQLRNNFGPTWLNNYKD